MSSGKGKTELFWRVKMVVENVKHELEADWNLARITEQIIAPAQVFYFSSKR